MSDEGSVVHGEARRVAVAKRELKTLVDDRCGINEIAQNEVTVSWQRQALALLYV